MDEKRNLIIKLLGQINMLEDSEKAFDELIEHINDLLEFYTSKQEYDPEPLSEVEMITLRKEKDEQGGE